MNKYAAVYQMGFIEGFLDHPHFKYASEEEKQLMLEKIAIKIPGFLSGIIKSKAPVQKGVQQMASMGRASMAQGAPKATGGAAKVITNTPKVSPQVRQGVPGIDYSKPAAKNPRADMNRLRDLPGGLVDLNK